MKTIRRKRLIFAMAPERLEHYLVPTMENQLVCLIACALCKLSLLARSLSPLRLQSSALIVGEIIRTPNMSGEREDSIGGGECELE